MTDFTRLARYRSERDLEELSIPLIPNLSASASVDLPLPRGPMMHVSPTGRHSSTSSRKPPLISTRPKYQLSSILQIPLRKYENLFSFSKKARQTNDEFHYTSKKPLPLYLV